MKQEDHNFEPSLCYWKDSVTNVDKIKFFKKKEKEKNGWRYGVPLSAIERKTD